MQFTSMKDFVAQLHPISRNVETLKGVKDRRRGNAYARPAVNATPQSQRLQLPSLIMPPPTPSNSKPTSTTSSLATSPGPRPFLCLNCNQPGHTYKQCSLPETLDKAKRVAEMTQRFQAKKQQQQVGQVHELPDNSPPPSPIEGNVSPPSKNP